jgi:hypothetical protein
MALGPIPVGPLSLTGLPGIYARLTCRGPSAPRAIVLKHVADAGRKAAAT